MSNKIKVSELADFDAAECLSSEQDVAAYLTTVLEENDPSLLAAALGDIARARQVAGRRSQVAGRRSQVAGRRSQVARDAGIAREALYKALRPGSAPRYETISRVCAALGVRLVVQPKHSAA
jgi:DNA-binding phage protein